MIFATLNEKLSGAHLELSGRVQRLTRVRVPCSREVRNDARCAYVWLGFWR